MRLWNRIFVLLLVVCSLAFVGCNIFGDDDEDDYSGPLTGSIKLSAEVDGGGNIFDPSLRAELKEALGANASAKNFKARIKIGAVTRLFSVAPKTGDNTKLELKDAVVDSLTPGKLQIAIEIVASSSAETGEPILKTIQTATVAAGQTNEDLAKAPPTVNATSTAKAIAYESWTGKDSKTIDDFTPVSADIENLAQKIQSVVVQQIVTPTTDFSFVKEDPTIKTAAEETATKVVVNDTAPDLVKAAVKAYIENTFKIYAGSITSTERTALGNVIAEDFISMGFDKAAYVANTGDENGLTLVSHTPTLTKISETEYKVDVSITVSNNGKQETVNSVVDGLAFDGSKFSAASLCPNLADFPVMVKKQSDGSWKIAGNRSKLGWFDLHIDFGNVNGSTGSQMWANVEDGKTYKIKSGYVTGGHISASAQLGKANSTDTAWNFWDGSKTSMYPFNGSLWGSSVAHAGQKYTLSVTFTDNTTQTFELTVPTLPAGIAAPATNAITASIVNNKLVVTYPKNSLTGFESYEINVFGNTRAQFRVENENTTALEVPLSGKDTDGNDYNITIGGQYWLSVYAFVGKGSFAHGAGSNVTLLQAPPLTSQRLSGNYRLFHYNASTQNRWCGMSEATVNNGQITDTVKLDPDASEINTVVNVAVSESAGALTFTGQPYKRGAVAPSGNIAIMHEWKSDDPMVSIFVKKPTAASVATLNGTYRMYEVGEDVGANYAPQKSKVQAYTMSFDGNGNCSATKGFDPDSMWDGAVSTTDTYSVTADGKVTFGGASGMTDFIQVSPDGNVIVAVGFASDNLIMTVGIRESNALNIADMNGNWVYTCVSAGPGTPYSFTDGQLVNYNNGASTWTGGVSDVSTEVPADSTRNVVLGSNGTLNIDADTYGSLSPSKDLLVTVSKGTGGNDTMRYFTLSVKK